MAINLEDVIERVSGTVKKRYPGIDRDDIRQEIWLWVFENQRKVARWIADDEADGDGRKVLYTALRRAGMAAAAKEHAQQTGYVIEDLHYYSYGQLRELLPLVMDRETWYLQGQTEERGAKNTSDPALGNNRLAMICDVRSSLEAGSEADKELLWIVFGLHRDEEEYAEELGIAHTALKMRVQRALKRLQDRLGGPNPLNEYVGGRRAISNAQAQAITHNQEDPE